MEKNKMKEEYQSKLWDYNVVEEEKFDWRGYNRSQTGEKRLFLSLLKELLETVDKSTDQYLSKGARNYFNQIFPMCLKVFLGTSSRRLISDLKMCKEIGLINNVPHFNTILNYFKNQSLKTVLNYLIELSAIPLAQIDKKFAVDSTGIGAHQYEPWRSIRSKYPEHRKYKKAHIIYGVLTNVAVSCSITKGTEADSPQFENLLKRCADNFKIDEVSADLAYSSKKNLRLVEEHGGIPYIPFKKNATGKRGGSLWKEMFQYFKYNQKEFLKHYHLRSNAETGFFMIKKKFGEFVEMKGDISQENEIRCKILCHNICVLIQEIFLSGIKVDFDKCLKNFVAQDKI
jgi:transposase